MRDLIERHERAAMLDLTGAATLVPRMGRQASQPPTEADRGGPATSHPTGAGTGSGGLPDAILAHGLPSHLVDIPEAGLVMPADIAWAALIRHVGAVWDTVAEGAAGMTFTATEPWEEADERYRPRLGDLDGTFGEPFTDLSGFDLDDLGALVGMPRARLARVEGVR